MTNEQTFIILKLVHSNLQRAIEDAKELAPEAAFETRNVHASVFTAAGGLCLNLSDHRESNPDHYHEEKVAAWLEPLEAFADSLNEDVKMLLAERSGENDHL